MALSSFRFCAAAFLALSLAAVPAVAQSAENTLSDGKVKVGVLTDIAGPTAMANGKGSVIAAEMAAEDFGTRIKV